MGISESIILGDVEQIFLDCGRDAELAEVFETYDPRTGRREQADFRYPVNVVVLPEQIRPTAATAASAPWGRRRFLLRRSDAPATLSLTAAKLIFEGTNYEISSFSESALTGVLLLECVSSRVAGE
jgi:hypothetical protein